MSIIINFFGGPGIGKSTQAASLFSLMKRNHYNVELTFEFPKLMTWDENYSAVNDQFFITANQHRNISRLYGKVDYIIVDSPILLGVVYKNKYNNISSYPSSFYDESFDNFVLNLFKKYENNTINVFLKRNQNQFESIGRLQSYDESVILDDEIKKTLNKYDVPFFEFSVNTNTSNEIFNSLIKK